MRLRSGELVHNTPLVHDTQISWCIINNGDKINQFCPNEMVLFSLVFNSSKYSQSIIYTGDWSFHPSRFSISVFLWHRGCANAGRPFYPGPSHYGLAHIFYRNEGGTDNWGQQKILSASGTIYFGYSVCINGDYAIVGSFNYIYEGAAYIFYRNEGGIDNWGQQAKLTASDGTAGDQFGRSVLISGDYAIVGAGQKDQATGSAYIFYRNEGGIDNWGQQKKLTASDGAVGDHFGGSVSISGDYAIAGAEYNDHAGGTDAGAVYIFYCNEGGTDNWGEQVKLTASDGAAGDHFGRGVWSNGVSISGDYAIVGAYLDDHNGGTNAGSAYIFYRNEGGTDNWGEQMKLTASDAAAEDQFGFSVSISRNYAIAGASRDNDAGSNSGSAYIYDLAPTALTLVCKTDKDIYNPWERVQVLADVDNPGESFTAKLLGGIIVLRLPPKKPLLLTGDVITKTIEPGLNSNIALYVSKPAITGLLSPEGTHGAFSIIYQENQIIALDAGTWGLKGPPEATEEKYFSDFIRSYIDRYGLEQLRNANADVTWSAPMSDAPLTNALGKAFPGIANPETWFPFQLSEASEVTIEIHNTSGQLVKTINLGYKQSGHYLNKAKAAFWDGKNDRGERVASGIYFYTMQTRNFTATGKVVILK